MADPTRRLAPALHALIAQSRQDADADLLGRFVAARDEPAFGELMRRHGPMVLGVSRRVTRDGHAAEDVFQATFLLLARKAASIRRAESLGGWLHQTAFRLALRSRRLGQAVESSRPLPAHGPNPLDALTARELLAAVDEELAGLPDEYRAAVVACGLEGLSLEEAARHLGWSVGSVKGRLERGRARLRQRLEERGLTLSGAMVGPLCSGGSLPGAVLESARAVALGGEVKPAVLALVDGGLPMVSATKLGMTGAALMLCGVIAFGAMWPVEPPAEKAPPAAAKGEPLPAGARMRLGDLERRAVGAKVAVTADGSTIVAVSPDTRQITEWDFRTGKLRDRRTLPIKEVGAVRELSPDGRWLLTNERAEGRYEQRAVVWDVRTGKVARKLPFTGAHHVDGPPAAFSADGRRLVLPALVVDEKDDKNTKHQIRVWEWQSGTELFVADIPGRESIQQVAFSADGNQVLVKQYGLQCWDVAAKKKLWTNAPWYTLAMLVMPQGKVLSLERRRLKELDLLTGAVTATLSLPPCDDDHNLNLTRKGDRLLLSCREGVVVWDVERGRRVLTLPGPYATVVPAPDGGSVVTNIGTIQRWDLVTGKPAFTDEDKKGHVDEVRTLVYTAGGSRLVSGSADGAVAVWDVATGRPEQLWRQHEPRRVTRWHMHPHGGVKTLDVTPDGRRIFSAGEADGQRLWDAAAGKELASFPKLEPLNESYSETTHSVRLARDGRSALALQCPGSGGFGKEVTGRLLRWDFDTGKVTTVSRVDRLVYWTSGVDPEGRWFANLGRVFDARTRREFASLGEYGKEAPVDAWFSPDGLLIAGGTSWRSDNNSLVRRGGPSIHVWEAATGKVVARLPGPGRTGEKVFHPSGRYLVYNQHRTIEVLDLRAEKTVKTWEMPAEMNIDGHGHARVSSFAFSPDGKTLATGHPDGTILLWDVALPAEKVAPVRIGELAELWKQLGDGDARKAYLAAWRLAELPAEAVALLRENVKPLRPAGKEVTAPLIADLDGDTRAKRDDATMRLGEMGHSAGPALREALKAPASAEQKRRLQQLVSPLELLQPTDADERRALRAVQVLGWVNTPESRTVLRSLAEGAAIDPVTRQAKATLARR